MTGWITQRLDRAALRRWTRAARDVPARDLARLAVEAAEARRLRDRLDAVIHAAGRRLAAPVPPPARDDGADVVWRPAAWAGPLPQPGRVAPPTGTRIADDLALFHDCARPEIVVRQRPGDTGPGAAPFGLVMEVFGFDGSYLSLAQDLPAEAVRGLGRDHLVALEMTVARDRPQALFARLNLRHGPNTDQIVLDLPTGEERISVEFDLAYTEFDAGRLEAAWIDLIFDDPRMTCVHLRDLTLARLPRAAF